MPLIKGGMEQLVLWSAYICEQISNTWNAYICGQREYIDAKYK